MTGLINREGGGLAGGGANRDCSGSRVRCRVDRNPIGNLGVGVANVEDANVWDEVGSEADPAVV